MKNPRTIDVVCAATNNLQDVSVAIPENALTAVIGVSGSGKSSLVEGTVAAVAADRTRRFLGLPGAKGAADVPAFVGATPPVISVAQQSFQATTRQTVATSSALMRVLRRLYARYSAPHLLGGGEPVPAPTPENMAQWLNRHANGKVIVWAVPICERHTDGTAACKVLADAGIAEAIVYSETDRGKRAETGTRVSTSRFNGLQANVRHTIEAKVGEVRITPRNAPALLGLLRTAWQAGGGAVFVEMPESENPAFSGALAGAFARGLDSRRHRVHPAVTQVFRAADVHLLSFNAPSHADSGACRFCNGLGVAPELQQDLLVVRPDKSMHEGAFALWTQKNYRYVNIQHATIEGLRGRDGFDPDIPWKHLPQSAKDLLLHGSGDAVVDIDPLSGKKISGPHLFVGFRAAILDRVARLSPSAAALKHFVSSGHCPACAGSRWCPEARALRVGKLSIDEVLAAPFTALMHRAPAWRQSAQEEGQTGGKGSGAGVLIDTVTHIAQSFVDVGLGHLSGNRSLLDVSDGEARRIKLAGVLNSRLSGLLLVLDEPGRGLHEADLVHLAKAIGEATRKHTVLMSEHRMRLVQNAQQVIQLGPESGRNGGRLVAAQWDEFGKVTHKTAGKPSPMENGTFLEIVGADANNVRGQNVRIPLGTMTCIAGVSGSGKSSFIRGVLVPALCERLPESSIDIGDFKVTAGGWKTCSGREHIKSLVAMDQKTSTGQARSLVGTFLGLAEHLRREFAATEQARRLRLSASDFGTNSGSGRCQSCLGLGIDQDGGSCSICGGLRFGHDVLSVRVAGLNMAEWLDLALSELNRLVFSWLSAELVHSVMELGIGHLSLGRSLGTLSGGEVQRLRLARAIAVEASVGAVFVLDEPACGLHPLDVHRLHRALRHLVSNGKNTVIAVEHDPLLLSACDYVVEFGPCGGPEGGVVVSQGTPAEILTCKTPTGWALRNPPKEKSAPPAQPDIARNLPQSLSEALAARQEIRQILGDDVAPLDDGRTTQPGAIFDHVDNGSRPLELGGMDRSLVSIALDMLPQSGPMLEALLRVWDHHPGAALHVNPLLEATSVWGTAIPAAVIKRARADARAMGLDDFAETATAPLDLRVSGARLRVAGTDQAGRMVALRDAWALGSGFVDLIDTMGKSVANATSRLIDFDQGIAGPRRPRAEHFVRSSRFGCCPMCSGRGLVPEVNEQAVIGNPGATVFDEDFLAPELSAKLKGFRRSVLIPFFRRMKAEGLWRDISWRKMSDGQRAVVLWGFWIRPGLGTFLKPDREKDGSEINHWLTWNGLACELELLQRTAGKSKSHTRAETSSQTCPMCEGCGLCANSRLLALAGRTLFDWTQNGRVCDFVGALKKMHLLGPRQERERLRVLHCIHPIEKYEGRLSQPIEESNRRKILSLVADQFTGLPAFFD